GEKVACQAWQAILAGNSARTPCRPRAGQKAEAHPARLDCPPSLVYKPLAGKTGPLALRKEAVPVLMPYRPLPALGSGVWRWRLLAALLILGAAGLHVAYLAVNCPLDLAPDEAHYWDWSRHLDGSYYSKGPLVAYLIRGGCELFGTGPLGVRLPAV